MLLGRRGVGGRGEVAAGGPQPDYLSTPHAVQQEGLRRCTSSCEPASGWGAVKKEAECVEQHQCICWPAGTLHSRREECDSLLTPAHRIDMCAMWLGVVCRPG